MTYTELGVEKTVDRLLAEHGLADPITPEQLNLLDQYHIGGLDAVDYTTAAMALTQDDRVLDIGSGFGGPARRIAAKHGATVHGIDITRDYVDTATNLTQRCGLGHLVSFECAGIEDHHPAQPYTAALSMHVQMNIADKAHWYRSIADRLAEGSAFGIWDVCSTNSNAPIRWPMPWSIDGTDSHIVAPDDLLAAITGAGFDCLDWADESDWVSKWVNTTFGAGPPVGPGIPMIIDDGWARTANFAGALAAGTFTVVRGRFTKHVS
ncbi:MAG: sarcosine/dimethylglycine N-methyltransferase [Mycobacterium sp.]|jgi:SAM-dependent methyltransferase|nr:sarcosine/dimethylglycine N-methyltransferase [Mycobacterium sp.]